MFPQCHRCITYAVKGQLGQYGDSLRAGPSGDRIPVDARFSARLRTGPGLHLASYTMGTASLPRVKRTVLGADNPQHLALRLE